MANQNTNNMQNPIDSPNVETKSRLVLGLFGTTSQESGWREELLGMIDPRYEYVDPDMQTLEESSLSRLQDCKKSSDIHLYLLSPAGETMFQIAELMEGIYKEPGKIIFTYLYKDNNEQFDSTQETFLDEIGKKVEAKGGMFFKVDNLHMLAGALNMLFRLKTGLGYTIIEKAPTTTKEVINHAINTYSNKSIANQQNNYDNNYYPDEEVTDEEYYDNEDEYEETENATPEEELRAKLADIPVEAGYEDQVYEEDYKTYDSIEEAQRDAKREALAKASQSGLFTTKNPIKKKRRND